MSTQTKSRSTLRSARPWRPIGKPSGGPNPFDLRIAETPVEYGATAPRRSDRVSGLPQTYFYDVATGVKLIWGDCVDVMSRAPDECVEVVFADPPYFLSNNGVTCHAGRMVSVNKGKWDASNGVIKDHDFVKLWLAQCQRVLKPSGTIWVSGTLHVIYSVGYAMQELGFKILNDIIWQKPNPPPHLACRYFAHATETILWARKSEKDRHYFNYALMKELNGGKQMKNIWTVAAPDKQEKRHGKHPTQKPVALLERIILASSKPGDLILDPFNGSGTTGVAAVRHGRKYVGIELDEKFLEVSRKRITDELTHRTLFPHESRAPSPTAASHDQ